MRHVKRHKVRQSKAYVARVETDRQAHIEEQRDLERWGAVMDNEPRPPCSLALVLTTKAPSDPPAKRKPGEARRLAEDNLRGVTVYQRSTIVKDLAGEVIGAFHANAITKEQREAWIQPVVEALRVMARPSKCNLVDDKRWDDEAQRLGCGFRFDRSHNKIGAWAWQKDDNLARH